MMNIKLCLVLFIVLILAAISSFGQEFTLNTTAANVIASRAVVDLPALNGNLQAIIVATPLGNTASLNPHPAGAWYLNNKWHIFNSDHATMPIGAVFQVQYFPQPDSNHFLHIITGSSATLSRSYLDYPVLNNQPNAQFRILQNHAPDNRAFYLNPSEAKAVYDAANGKWFIENVNGTPLHPNTAYNIVIFSGGSKPTINKPVGNNSPTNPPNQSTAAPAGTAGGDLSGNYPNPNVVGLSGRPLSNKTPAVGDILRWNGTEWEPVQVSSPGSSSSSSGGTTFTPGLGLSMDGTTLNTLNTTPIWNAGKLAGRDIMTTAPAAGQVLKWGGSAWYPADDNVGTAAASVPAVQTFFKKSPFGASSIAVNDAVPEIKMTALSQTVVLSKPSRLVISATVLIFGNHCPLGCSDGEGRLFMRVNNNLTSEGEMFFFIPHDKTVSLATNNFMVEVGAGTSTIEFFVDHSNGTSAFEISPRYSSIMVVPM